VIEFGDPKVAVSCTDQHEDWAPGGAGDEISRTFTFRDFHETMSFVNAVAWIANQEGHHPDLTVGYDRCTVRYATHSIGGLSENDFIGKLWKGPEDPALAIVRLKAKAYYLLEPGKWAVETIKLEPGTE